jgi:hypothetical protein
MRDTHVTALRPKLNLDSENSNTIESFQNNTLRPILKLQHELTLAVLYKSKHFSQHLKSINLMNPSDVNDFIKNFLSNDKNLRNKIIGMIVGMMTTEELDYYLNHESELNKRISSMQVKRYADTILQST